MQVLTLKIPPLVVLIIFALAMWLNVSIYPDAHVNIPYANFLAVFMVLIGILAALAGVFSFKKAKTTVNPMTPEKSSSLVNTGIYRVTRNPMYVGMLCWLIALAFFFSHLMAFVWCPLFIIYMNQFQIKPEEQFLAELFGDDYINYCHQVKRWL